MWRGRVPSPSYAQESTQLARMRPTAHFECRLFLLRHQAYMALRKNAPLLLNLLQQMVDSNTPNITMHDLLKVSPR